MDLSEFLRETQTDVRTQMGDGSPFVRIQPPGIDNIVKPVKPG